MKVYELMQLLTDMDPDANVLLMEQPSWPFENDIYGVVERSCFENCEEPEDEFDIPDSEKNANDVFLLEGSQLRYGNKEAWENI